MTRRARTGPGQPRASRSKAGRTAGVKNREYDIVEAELTKCRKCGSTERSAYEGKPDELRQKCSDVVVVTTWKRCQCVCGQWRKDKYQHREPIEPAEILRE